MRLGLSIFAGLTSSLTLFTYIFFYNMDKRINSIQQIMSEERQAFINTLEYQKRDLLECFINQREKTFIMMQELIEDEKLKFSTKTRELVHTLSIKNVFEKLMDKYNIKRENILNSAFNIK